VVYISNDQGLYVRDQLEQTDSLLSEVKNTKLATLKNLSLFLLFTDCLKRSFEHKLL